MVALKCILFCLALHTRLPKPQHSHVYCQLTGLLHSSRNRSVRVAFLPMASAVVLVRRWVPVQEGALGLSVRPTTGQIQTKTSTTLPLEFFDSPDMELEPPAQRMAGLSSSVTFSHTSPSHPPQQSQCQQQICHCDVSVSSASWPTWPITSQSSASATCLCTDQARQQRPIRHAHENVEGI